MKWTKQPDGSYTAGRWSISRHASSRWVVRENGLRMASGLTFLQAKANAEWREECAAKVSEAPLFVGDTA